MITVSLKCYHCGSTAIVRHGRTANAKQRYECHECGRSSREHPQPQGYAEAEGKTILSADAERSSLPAKIKTWGFSQLKLNSSQVTFFLSRGSTGLDLASVGELLNRCR